MFAFAPNLGTLFENYFPCPALEPTLPLFFLISKKRILLIKEKQEKHTKFTVVNKGRKKQRDRSSH